MLSFDKKKKIEESSKLDVKELKKTTQRKMKKNERNKELQREKKERKINIYEYIVKHLNTVVWGVSIVNMRRK